MGPLGFRFALRLGSYSLIGTYKKKNRLVLNPFSPLPHSYGTNSLRFLEIVLHLTSSKNISKHNSTVLLNLLIDQGYSTLYLLYLKIYYQAKICRLLWVSLLGRWKFGYFSLLNTEQ